MNTMNTMICLFLCRVSLDGSWQRRGHASLHGVVTTISNGKCIDTEILSKFCRGCTMWNSKKGTPAYDIWKTEHMCEINHTKSSGAMEGAGATSMFCRSVEKNNLIYEEYLGDGDTSSFKEVVDSNPYEEQGIIPKKLECVGHVQKRLGTRLRKVVKNYKRVDKLKKNGKDVEKVIKLSGKGKLTDTAINSMQNYYGLAIRSNKGNIYTMKKAVLSFTIVPILANLSYVIGFVQMALIHGANGSWINYMVPKDTGLISVYLNGFMMFFTLHL